MPSSTASYKNVVAMWCTWGRQGPFLWIEWGTFYCITMISCYQLQKSVAAILLKL